MKLEFDPAVFVNRIGARLVMDFDDASSAGTPGLIGSSREHPARIQLGKLMPAYVAIGTGIVMDSYGDRSHQQDIVLYERDFCPIYCINDSPDATYFPVEGVVAVGEVKSTMDKAAIVDALAKIKMAKKLKRFSVKTDSGLGVVVADYRSYGSTVCFAAVRDNEYDQNKNFRDQIYGFILCRSFKNSADAVLNNIREFGSEEGFDYLPNFILSLDDGFIQNVNHTNMSLQHSPLTADGLAFCPEKVRAFTLLVQYLFQHCREGRTVPRPALDRYMSSTNVPLLDSISVKYS